MHYFEKFGTSSITSSKSFAMYFVFVCFIRASASASASSSCGLQQDQILVPWGCYVLTTESGMFHLASPCATPCAKLQSRPLSTLATMSSAPSNSRPSKDGCDHKWLEDPSEELKCLICLSVAQQHGGKGCGKLFCESCISEHQKRSTNCPHCWENLTLLADVIEVSAFCINT